MEGITETGPRGPWVTMAAICTAVEREPTGGLAIRGVMGQSHVILPERARSVPGFGVDSQVKLALWFAGGESGTTARVGVETEGADGARREADESVIAHFEGEPGLARLSLDLHARFWGPQLYWFNVLLDGRLMTRVPFEVGYRFVSEGEYRRLGLGVPLPGTSRSQRRPEERRRRQE